MRVDEEFPAASHGTVAQGAVRREGPDIRSPWAAWVSRRRERARPGGRDRWQSLLLLAGWSYIAYIMLLGALLVAMYAAAEQASESFVDKVVEAAVIITSPVMGLFALESHAPGVSHGVANLVMVVVIAWALLGHWTLGHAAVAVWRARRARRVLQARLGEGR